ncbi:MAG: hypothetical protein JNJ88_00245 [Planctomycetes bacterium]|nr:hypothetical protein [Planctomycetota bacterium]
MSDSDGRDQGNPEDEDAREGVSVPAALVLAFLCGTAIALLFANAMLAETMRMIVRRP